MKTDNDSRIQMKSLFLAAKFHDSEQRLEQQWCLQGMFLDQLKHVGKTDELFSLCVFLRAQRAFLQKLIYFSQAQQSA